jgi:hypothetical protein
MGLPGILPRGCLLLLLLPASEAILFPRDSPSRESKSLDGLWNFKISPKVTTLRLFHFRDHPLSQRLPLQGVKELRWALELQNLAKGTNIAPFPLQRSSSFSKTPPPGSPCAWTASGTSKPHLR